MAIIGRRGNRRFRFDTGPSRNLAYAPAMLSALGATALAALKRGGQIPGRNSAIPKRRPAVKARSKSTALAVIPKKRSAKYTADPTNRVSTSASGGMTTHSMTVSLGSKKNLMQKLVSSSKESWTFRFGAIQPFNNTTAVSVAHAMTGGGAYPLINYNTLAPAGVGAFQALMPLHVFDITSCNNINQATPVYGPPCYQLQFNGVAAAAGIYPSNAVDFTQLNGRTSDGVSISPNWQIEKTGHPVSQTYPFGSIMQEWVQIKMLCYGAQTYSTRFKVQVVQISEDDFHPLEVSNLSAIVPVGPTPWDDVSASINFWQGISSASYKHPIASVSTDYKKKLKVIKEFNFIIDPTTTIEERADVGHSKALNIFVPMYRKNNYNSKAQGVDGSLADADNYAPEIDKCEAFLKPSARVYLIVQATNPYTKNAGVAYTPANTPSYDVVIRSKFSQLS